jgi:hypothetical protein
MNKGGWLQYKCRKCGKIEQNIHAPDATYALLLIMNGHYDTLEKIWGGMPVRQHSIHCCKNGEYGVSDLIGCIEDKEDT